MTYIGGPWWELRLERGWRFEDHAECLSLTRSETGAFQLSAAIKTHGDVEASEVEEQSRKGTPDGAKVVPLVAGAFSGLCVGYVEEGVHWQRFWLANANILVFATYNGLPETWLSERDAVYLMLSTLRPRACENVLPA